MNRENRWKVMFTLTVSLIIVVLILSAVSPALASPKDDLSDLIADVEVLIADGTLGQGTGNALIAKLEAAQQSLAQDQANAAANQLEAFMNQVNALLQSNRIDADTGQELLSEAAYIQAVIGCIDPLGCAVFGAAEPIKIASALTISGPGSFLGIDSQRGVEIALDLRSDLFDHPLELRAEDAGCSPEGGETVANILTADPKVVAVVGTNCSGAAITAAPIVSDAGYVMVSPSNTAPVLTDPQYHTAGYLRTAWNDKNQVITMAEFLWMQGAQTSAVITTGDSYTQGMGDAFVQAFTAAGGSNLTYEILPSDEPADVAAALDAISAAGPPDVIYFPVFLYEGYLIVTQARDRAIFDNTLLAAADGVFDDIFFEFTAPASEGMLVSAPVFNFTDIYANELYPVYVARYGEPVAPFHAHAFDAANVILDGIEATAVVKEGTVQIGRQALRHALYATEGMAGATGTITCDQYGDCGVQTFTIYEVQGGEPVPIWPE